MKKIFFIFLLFFPILLFAQKNNLGLRTTITSFKQNIYKAKISKDLINEAYYTEKLSRLYWSNRIYTDAIINYNELLKIETKRGNRLGMMSVYENLGIIYRDLSKYRQSLYEFNLLLPIANQIGNKMQVYQCHLYIANVFGLMHKYKDAIAETERAMWVVQSMNKINEVQNCFLIISKYYEASGDTEKAMEFYRRFAGSRDRDRQQQISQSQFENLTQAKTLQKTKDSLKIVEDSLKKVELESDKRRMKFDLLKKENIIRDAKLSQRETELASEKHIRNIMFIAGAILICMGAFLYREHYKIKQLNNRLSIQNQEISFKQQEIIIQKDEIEAQNDRLELSQKKIIDAQATIQEQNIKLQSYNRNLEKQVEERTNALQKAFDDLLAINNDLDTLTYRASHDLKSPVATLDGMCTVALMEIKDELPSFYFQQIKTIAKGMSSLLDNLSKLRDIKHTLLKKEEHVLSVLIEDVIKNNLVELPETKNINFTNKTPINLIVKTDIEIFKLVLQNVLQNSVQFSLSISDNHTPFIQIVSEDNPDFIEISVIDNSEEIGEEISQKIFNMFFRGSQRSKGAGLGLYTARSAAEKLGGSIEYKKGNNKENIFIIHINKQEKELQVVTEPINFTKFSSNFTARK